jgi:hypothetical protein
MLQAHEICMLILLTLFRPMIAEAVPPDAASVVVYMYSCAAAKLLKPAALAPNITSRRVPQHDARTTTQPAPRFECINTSFSAVSIGVCAATPQVPPGPVNTDKGSLAELA